MATILLIEGNEELSTRIVQLLQGNHEVHRAKDGHQALQLSARHPWDLVVSEIRIEGDRSGVTVLEKIRSLRPTMKTLLMTGLASEDAPLRAVKVPVQGRLMKPFEDAQLVDLVERLLATSLRQSPITRLFSRWVRDWVQTRKTQASHQLDQQRNAFYESYYESIRSQKLACRAALEIWDRLDAVERRYRRCNLDRREQVGGCGLDYSGLRHKTLKMAASGEPGGMRHRFSYPRFKAFYDRIQKGEISPEHFKPACSELLELTVTILR